MEVDVRILGILFVQTMGICFGLEICTLKVAFEKQIIHSVNFLVVCITKMFLSRFEKSTCLFECKSLFLEPKFSL